jgi:segregation and condensation protein B
MEGEQNAGVGVEGVESLPATGAEPPVVEVAAQVGKPAKGKRPKKTPAETVDLGIPVEELAPVLEAVLLSVDRPTPAERLAEGLQLAKVKGEGENAACDPAELAAAVELIARTVELLNAQYAETGRAFRIQSVAGGYRLMTLPAFADRIAQYHQARVSGKLSRAAVETLAIVAYKQPLTKAALEAIRGVSCGEVLKTLMDRRLVTIKGRAEELGRPMLYGTTKQFLDQFGLASIKDLPAPGELKAQG